MALLERAGADNAEAVSDLSEDMRRDRDDIYQDFGALSVKIPKPSPPSRPVGFKK